MEFLPDFILMPNMGTRAVMWQEIEGKLRNSPSRMAISIFHSEDIFATLIRLTGDFRWEMCKRIQGARWNDVSDHSLTSDYFDYVQFYRKNRDLSAEIKEKIKSSLQRAKNSFKQLFVPGMVFDVSGYRIGYGKGYYDRFLSEFTGTTAGICYSNCVKWKMPRGFYDRSVDILVTDRYFRKCSSRYKNEE